MILTMDKEIWLPPKLFTMDNLLTEKNTDMENKPGLDNNRNTPEIGKMEWCTEKLSGPIILEKPDPLSIIMDNLLNIPIMNSKISWLLEEDSNKGKHYPQKVENIISQLQVVEK